MLGFGHRPKLMVQKPCHESWDAMTGDNFGRFCDSCRKHVHDISRLTRKETAKLLRESKGTLCARITRDPKGEVVYRRDGNPVVSLAGLSLISASALAAQSPCRLAVKVTDSMGMPVGGAQVTVALQTAHTSSDAIAEFRVPAGTYDIQTQMPGFKIARRKNVQVSCENAASTVVNVELPIGAFTMGAVVLTGRAPFFRRLRSLFHL